jgi:hypothetical protein
MFADKFSQGSFMYPRSKQTHPRLADKIAPPSIKTIKRKQFTFLIKEITVTIVPQANKNAPNPCNMTLAQMNRVETNVFSF